MLVNVPIMPCILKSQSCYASRSSHDAILPKRSHHAMLPDSSHHAILPESFHHAILPESSHHAMFIKFAIMPYLLKLPSFHDYYSSHYAMFNKVLKPCFRKFQSCNASRKFSSSNASRKFQSCHVY